MAAAAAAGILSSVANKAMDYGMQSMLMAKENKYYQRNQRQAFNYSQEAQKNAIPNQVAGLLAAGMSPALAAGQPSTAAPMASTPMQNKNLSPNDMASMIGSFSQAKLQESQEANLDEQTRKLKIANDRAQNEDSEYNKLISNMVADWRKKIPDDSILQGVYDEIEKNPEKFSKGTFDALKDATDFAAFVRETAARVAEADVKNLVASMQQRGGIWKDIASLPHEELKLMMEEQKLKRALAVNAYAQTQTEGAKQKELEAQQKELEQRAKYVEEETRRMRYGKYGNMKEHGDYGAAIAEILGGAAEEGAKKVATEGAELGADVIRSKTGTPHGIFKSKSESSHSGTRSGSSETWKDRRGHTHTVYDESAFPAQ